MINISTYSFTISFFIPFKQLFIICLIFWLKFIEIYENDENCPIFLKCKFPTRLELIKYMAKRDPKYKEILNDVESDPYNYLKLCHNFYDTF